MKQTDFAERLTQALDLRGLSAADLSRATGVSDGTISCYKKGKYQAKQNRVSYLPPLISFIVLSL